MHHFNRIRISQQIMSRDSLMNYYFNDFNCLLVLAIDVKFKTIDGGKYILPDEFRDSDILPDLDITITANNIVSFIKVLSYFFLDRKI